MSKEKLSPSDWELVRNAPYWVNQALAEADGKVSFILKRRENKTFEEAIKGYKSANALIKDIISDAGDAAKEIGKASQADAEKALERIASIVGDKLGADDLAALKDFLLSIGNTVASSVREHSLGSAVSEKEKAALANIEKALKAVAPAAVAGAAAKPGFATVKPGPAMVDAAEAKVKAESEAKAKAESEAKDRLEKARHEAAERQQEAKARADAAAKAREDAAATKAEAEAKAREEAEAAAAAVAAAAAAAKPKYTQFIAEHTVKAGDNLSFISEKYYGTQANFRIIYEANKDVIGDNMSLIKPGQVLKIPKL